MTKILLSIPVALASLALSAHFLRAAQVGLAVACAAMPLLLVLRRRWVKIVLQAFLMAGALVWAQTAAELALLRMAQDLPWQRMALILGAVALLTAGAALVLQTGPMKRLLGAAPGSAGLSAAIFLLVVGLLTVVQQVVPRPMLILERLAPGFGWVEVLLLAAYGAWMGEKLLDVGQSAVWRRRLWWLFSIVFFAQLALGLMGLEQFLMSPGKLHLPVPALIAAGPLFRGERFFMPILFGTTLLLVGSAWCSHLCYLGAWDSAAADARRKPTRRPRWHHPTRVAALALVVGTALTLRLLGAGLALAFGAALAFGVVGVVVMLLLSRRGGTMVHCTVYCPMGLLANLLGKLSPFRLRMSEGCDGCARCRLACRFEALEPEAIRKRRPGLSCTLCGDCLSSCEGGFLEYRFPGLTPARARALFIVLVTALHAAVLGLARI